MNNYYRGANIEFTAKFADTTGAPIQPASVAISISYPTGPTTYANVQAAMTFDAGRALWLYEWNSAPSKPGQVLYSVKAIASENIAQDGDFILQANNANLAV